MANQKEKIDIVSESTKVISWTPTRAALFGQFPEVEVYLQDPGGVYYKAPIQPVPDAPPPAFTVLNFDFGGNVNGFITIM